VQLTRRRTQGKSLERIESSSCSSPSLSSTKDDADKSRMRKRIEELEGQLLDARAREEQRQMLAVQAIQQSRLQRDQQHQDVDHDVPLLSEHSIVPLNLGEPEAQHHEDEKTLT
jgi:hypothetical protein